MINLHIAGALGRCTTFAEPLHYKHVSRILIVSNTIRAFVDENLKAIENRPADRELYNALRKALKRAWWLKPRVYVILRWIFRALKRLTAPFKEKRWGTPFSLIFTEQFRYGLKLHDKKFQKLWEGEQPLTEKWKLKHVVLKSSCDPIAFCYPTCPSRAYKYRSSSEERHRNHPLLF